MIKIIEITSMESNGVIATVFSDTKAEVPATGIATAKAFSKKLSAGSILFTADLEMAVLKSDDNWNWVGESES